MEVAASQLCLNNKNVSEIMRRVRSKDTSPEIIFRKALWSKGIRYNLHANNLPGKPDIVITSKKLVIFIDGDFWHGGQWRRRNLSSLDQQFQNIHTKEYWLTKIQKNINRDCRVTTSLLSQGWTVLRFWESEVRRNLDYCIKTTQKALDNDHKIYAFSLLPKRTFIEFFAGIGLMRIGLEKQNWSVEFANDIDPDKQEMYKFHFGETDNHFVLGDIHKLSVEQVPAATLATASFPCNDLSLAGGRNGLCGQHSSALWGFTNILEKMGDRKPPLVLLENVTGFLTSHRGEDFKRALLELNRLGYTVDAIILDASRFVSQSRQRLFVIGVSRIASGSYPKQEPLALRESDVRTKALVDFILNHPEIHWRVRQLPDLPEKGPQLESCLEDLQETAEEWWDKERTEYLLNQMSPRHRAVAEEMMANSDWSYGTVFRRMRKEKSTAELRTDGLAGCLRTPRGGSGRQILFKAGKGKCFARLLTPRECARLMGVDEYKIAVPRNQALFGFGDAVCVPVIEWIAHYYLNPLINEMIRGVSLYNGSELSKNGPSRSNPA